MYLYYWFNSISMVRKMLSGSTSTGVPNMNLSTLKSLQVALPHLLEQESITDMLSSVYETIERGRTETEMLQSLKASAADALLTGRVRVRQSR